MAYGGGAAAAGAELEHVVDRTTKIIVTVLSSSKFNPAEIRESKLNLSQAYSLLWQEKESGEVSGRVSSHSKNSGSVAATVLDLVVKGKIEIDVQPTSTLGIAYNKNYVKVISTTLTDSYLDVALFEKLLKRHDKKPDDPKTLEDLIRSALTKWDNKETCVTASLDSLVDMGILERQKKLIGYKFPTINPGPEENYVRQIRKIALDGAEPDSFMWVLLVLMRAADDFYVLHDPFLKRHFSKQEYKGAKERIKQLVGVDQEGSAKYEAL